MLYEQLRTAILNEQPVVMVTIVAGPRTGSKILIDEDGQVLGTLDSSLDMPTVVKAALGYLRRGEHGMVTFPTEAGETTLFVESYPPPPTMLIVGAVHIAISLITLAKTLGFRTVVIDARGVFATEERFAHADELVLAWPDEALEGRITSNSYVVLLTHDPKLDDPALKLALPSKARYVGALGSPKTHEKRLARLRAEGLPEEQLARLHAPIGLKIGAATPEEIAVSIIAEIVAARHGLTKK
jgi:xanthine dehydrogenase accessory factor